MSAWNESDDEDSGDIFTLMYTNRETADEKFYFKEISDSQEGLTFKYSFCNEIHFESILLLEIPVDPSNKSLMRTVFSIGMCVCSWYWMGYNTPEIVVCQEVIGMCGITESMMGFWEKLYHNVTLEYVYVNKLPYRKVRFVLEGGPCTAQEVCVGTTQPSSDNEYSIIIPLGGGKDSLVVWHEYKQTHAQPQSQPPLLMYVADGLQEYDHSWRLKQLVKQTGDDIMLVRHDFQNELLHRVKRSYLKPCAHPWAALVLFDSLLVAQLTGIKEVTLGYERSADEGNGVFVENTVVLDNDNTSDIPTNTTLIADDTAQSYSTSTSSDGKVVKVVKEEVNHQYDKSSFFLALAQGYIAGFIDTEVKVVSTLHGLWELQIAKIFCRAPLLQPFLPIFLSCNEPTATNDWCCRCDKCAFIFLLLSAWLEPGVVVEKVFGGVDMLDDSSCVSVGGGGCSCSGNSDTSGGGGSGGGSGSGACSGCVNGGADGSTNSHSNGRKGLFMRLVGQGSKPFDCVGTANEAAAAVHLTAVRYGECIARGSGGGECVQVSSDDSSYVIGSSVGECGGSGEVVKALPPLLVELCAYLSIELSDDSAAPVVTDEEAILKHWGIV